MAIRGITEAQIVPLGRFARQHGFELRFIEFMPLDAPGEWTPDQGVPAGEILTWLDRDFGLLVWLALALDLAMLSSLLRRSGTLSFSNDRV